MEDRSSRGTRQEVDVHAPDAAFTELDVARAAPEVGPGRSPPRNSAISVCAMMREAPSANTPAFGTPAVATSPTAYTPGKRVLSVAKSTGT